MAFSSFWRIPLGMYKAAWFMNDVAASAYLCIHIPNHYPAPGPGDIPLCHYPDGCLVKSEAPARRSTALIDEVAAFDLILYGISKVLPPEILGETCLSESLGDGQDPRIQV